MLSSKPMIVASDKASFSGTFSSILALILLLNIISYISKATMRKCSTEKQLLQLETFKMPHYVTEFSFRYFSKIFKTAIFENTPG